MVSINKLKSNKQLSNLIVYGIGQGFSLITPLLVIPYLVRICSEKGYGKIAMGMYFAFFLIVLIDYGVDISGVKEISVNRDNKQKLSEIISTAYAARLLLLCAVLAFTVILILAVPEFYKDKEFYFLCMPILIGQFINPTWVFLGLENYKWISFLNIFSKIIYVTGIFLFVKFSGDYIYANLCWGIGTVAANGIAFIYLSTKYSISFSNTGKQNIKDYLRANFSLFFSQIFVSAQINLPGIIIGFIAGASVAGQYSIVDRVVGMFKTYITLFFSYVYPRVCYLVEENLKEGMRFWKRYNIANFIAIALVMAVLYLIAAPVIIYFKASDVTLLTSYLRFGLLLPLALAISVPLKQLILAFGHQKQYTRLTMLMVVFNLLLLIVLLPFFSIYGIFVSLVVTEIITAVFYSLMVKKQLTAEVL